MDVQEIADTVSSTMAEVQSFLKIHCEFTKKLSIYSPEMSSGQDINISSAVSSVVRERNSLNVQITQENSSKGVFFFVSWFTKVGGSCDIGSTVPIICIRYH